MRRALLLTAQQRPSSPNPWRTCCWRLLGEIRNFTSWHLAKLNKFAAFEKRFDVSNLPQFIERWSNVDEIFEIYCQILAMSDKFDLNVTMFQIVET